MKFLIRRGSGQERGSGGRKWQQNIEKSVVKLKEEVRWVYVESSPNDITRYRLMGRIKELIIEGCNRRGTYNFEGKDW